MNPMTCKKLT